MRTFIPSRNLILATTVLLVFIVPLRAQDLSQDYLMAHNKAREAVGVSPLMWDHEVASSAEYDAESRMETCYTEISGWQFGENIARGNSSMSGVEAVQMWVDEKVYYDYKSNTCISKKVCDHYTQVVWNTTQRVGCAKVQCKNGQMLVACNYYPAGNLPGERPYLIKETKSTI